MTKPTRDEWREYDQAGADPQPRPTPAQIEAGKRGMREAGHLARDPEATEIVTAVLTAAAGVEQWGNETWPPPNPPAAAEVGETKAPTNIEELEAPPSEYTQGYRHGFIDTEEHNNYTIERCAEVADDCGHGWMGDMIRALKDKP